MIEVIIPVIDQHVLTIECIEHLKSNSPDVILTIFDNGSETPYSNGDLVGTWIHQSKRNKGFYLPLKEVSEEFSNAEIIGMIHNDLFIYEEGWDKRVEQAFADDPQLALIGFCGSDQVDDRGGRGSGTMCNFAGIRGQLQAHTGRQITDLRPALILDSLAMFFRREAIPLLGIDENIVPCHFYDKIWSLKLIDAGYRVGVMGILCDHIGGRTSVGVEKYNRDAEGWCRAHDIPFNPEKFDSAAGEIYLEAERRLFREFGPKGLIPSRIDQDWRVHRHIGQPKYPHGI